MCNAANNMHVINMYYYYVSGSKSAAVKDIDIDV